MLATTVAVVALCGSVVSAHSPIQARDHHHIIQARQGTGSSSSSSTRAPTATGTPTATPTGTVSTAPTGTALPVPIVTAPGAIPLASILPDPATGPPTPTLTTPAAGATPHGLTGAPALPNLQGWNGVANYPPWDKVPPTDSDEVTEWIQQVRDSGVVIPDIKQRTNNPNGLCADPANAPRVGNDQECWWSCGRCTRSTDIVQCPTAKVWGSSLDDGPAPYSPLLLDYFAQNQISSTFFVVGSRVAQRPAYLQAEYIAGHTIGVHTWSHTPLTTQSSEQVIAELGWTKKVIKDAIGVTPKYFRPPYGDIDDRVRAIGRAMNMTAVMWSTTGARGSEVAFDTFDYNVPGGEKTAEQSVAQFSSLLHIAETYGTGFIVLAHDLWWQQVELSKSYFFPTALSLRYKVTSINDCMNQQLKDVYVETAGSTALPQGSGIGGQVTGTGQTAPKNAPLGGSDGTNTDPNVKAGAGNGGGGDAAPARMDTSMVTAFAGVVLAAGLSMAAAL